MKKSIFLSLLIITHFTFSHANVITLGNPKQINNFNLYLKKNSNKKSLTNLLMEKQLLSSEKTISDKHSLAVKGLLLEDLTPSIYLFKELTELKSHFIFSKKAQNHISESYFRLSNLERIKSNFWIKQGLLFNPDYKLSDQIFNPDIIRNYTIKLEEIKNYSFPYDLSALADENTHIYFNGVLTIGTINLNPSGNYNFKFFKEGYKELSLNLSGDNILKTKPIKLKKLNLGTCANPNFITHQGFRVDEIFFSKSCIKKISKQINHPAQKKLFKIHTDKPLKLPHKKNFFQKKSTWYAITGVTLASILIILLNNNNNEVRIEPVKY